MNEIVGGITWAAAHHIIVIPVVLIAICLLLYRYKKTNKVIRILAGQWTSVVVNHFSGPRSMLKVMLTSCAIVMIFFALLRPQWHKKEEVISQQGRDLLIALDVSRSMLATDCDPDRLSYAKKKIKKLVKKLACERVGLILFSGTAYLQCPLTTDYRAFSLFLDQVDVETISSGSTALDQAIKQALAVFKRMPSKKNKLLVMITDGEDFSTHLTQLKQEAQAEKLHIFALGVGTAQGAPIPLYNDLGEMQGHQKDEKGNVVISQLNEGILTSLAHDAGGMYIAVSEDDRDINTLYNVVQSYEKEQFDDATISDLEDQYHYFLLVSFFCLLFEWLL